MTDLLFLTAPPVGRFGRGLLAVLRQHESADGSRHHVQVKHRVTLAEVRKERKRLVRRQHWTVPVEKTGEVNICHADKFVLNNDNQ